MATTISFVVDGIKETALNKIAIANGMTPNEYAESVVTSFLKAQVRGYYQAKFNDLTTLEMINLFGGMT